MSSEPLQQKALRDTLVFKTRDDARVADGVEAPRSTEAAGSSRTSVVARAGSEMPWWEWVREHVDHRLEAFARTTETAVGQVVGKIRAQMREHCAGEIGVVKREVEQQNREFAVRLHEQMLECGRDLREEARAAREQQERRDAVTLYEIGVARRELALLREAGAEALGFIKRELEQQRAAFNAQTELQREREQLRAEVAKGDYSWQRGHGTSHFRLSDKQRRVLRSRSRPSTEPHQDCIAPRSSWHCTAHS